MLKPLQRGRMLINRRGSVAGAKTSRLLRPGVRIVVWSLAAARPLVVVD